MHDWEIRNSLRFVTPLWVKYIHSYTIHTHTKLRYVKALVCWVCECAMLGWQFTTDTTTSWVLATREAGTEGGEWCEEARQYYCYYRHRLVTVAESSPVIDSRDNDHQQQPILSHQRPRKGKVWRISLIITLRLYCTKSRKRRRNGTNTFPGYAIIKSFQ